MESEFFRSRHKKRGHNSSLPVNPSTRKTKITEERKNLKGVFPHRGGSSRREFMDKNGGGREKGADLCRRSGEKKKRDGRGGMSLKN